MFIYLSYKQHLQYRLELINLNLNVSSLKTFSTSSILMVDLEQNNTAPEPNVNPDIKLTNEQAEKLKLGLNELLENSEPMTNMELFDLENSTYEECFPNLVSKFNKQPIKEIVSEINQTNLITNNPFLKEAIQQILNKPEEFTPTKTTGLEYLELKNRIYGDFQGLLNKIKTSGPTTTNNDSPILQNLSKESLPTNSNKLGFDWDYNNNQFTCLIDIEKVNGNIKRLFETYNNNQDLIQLSGSLLIPAFGCLFIYKQTIKTYSKFSFEDINKLKISDADKLEYLKFKSMKMAKFSGKQALLITGSLMLFFKAFSLLSDNQNLIDVKININKTDEPTNNLTATLRSYLSSILPFFTRFNNKLKLPKWLLYLIIFIFIIIFIYFLITSTNFLFVYQNYNIKLIITFIFLILTSYKLISELIIVNLLLRFSIYKLEGKEIPIPRYLPKFIKNKLMELIKISGYESLHYFLLVSINLILSTYVALLFLLVSTFLNQIF